MRHPIDPKIDCVFKALLGAEANQRLLVHFLNAMLGSELAEPVVEVGILNPYNEREFLDDKLSVVDVKASDQRGRLYQIEIQLLVLPELPARILYGWADLYSAQLRSGEDYGELRPTYAIWLLGETLLSQVSGYAHRYRLRDEQGRELIDHGGIWLFELSKFAVEQVRTEEEQWLKFFNEGEHLEIDQPCCLHKRVWEWDRGEVCRLQTGSPSPDEYSTDAVRIVNRGVSAIGKQKGSKAPFDSIRIH